MNTQLYGCMKFGNEPAMFLSSVMITVKKFTGIESIDGDNSIIVICDADRFIKSIL